ncbi:quinone-dependent dihydroorotate dehydrogenase [Phormidium sp. FACHB-592]|uniref:Dihydroorotate dehydrogenase (quinone) n=1 Tax=Stenomitos frigidus AS-A4 TaxID=2933935 RepID=A0ABV0KF23_9CYAN|nr:quinone-dependent dihydroorotate dehydrogenase [Phormidium sp. FACHB-592]
MNIYRSVVRPVLFSGLKADPEWLHQQTLNTLGWLDQHHKEPSARWLQHQVGKSYRLADDRLTQRLWGLHFQNPIGLAAGFDKDGVASGIWSSFGFGFAELGTVTAIAQTGNPLPRLFRLPLDHAALNRMGFNNRGATVMAATLQQRWGERGEERGGSKRTGKQADGERSRSTTQDSDSSLTPASSAPLPPCLFPIGINLGKSKVTPLEEAATDYLTSFKLLKNWGDYFVVNVSSPNTPGLRSLQAADQLDPILAALQQENTRQKPLLIKIAPDLEWDEIATILDLAQKHHLAGIIATNTTIRRDGLTTQVVQATGKSVQEEAGGISGAPVRQRSTEVIRFIWQETQGQLPIIGVGGVFTPDDAWEKITAGASLVQVYTGWVYEGPGMVRRILEGLLQKLEERGFTSLSQATGQQD